MFHDWENYFFLIGSAAGGLIGLLFVVVTLTAGTDRTRALRAGAFYFTPTAYHFGAVLCASAVAVAPVASARTAGPVFALVALIGLAHGWRACFGIAELGRGSDAPHWSDFWTFGVIPAVFYALLLLAAAALSLGFDAAEEICAALLLLLLLIGVRNAWDLVTWMAPGSKA